MKKNDLLTLTADGLGADLEGVCRADGMAVFVPGMLPGETARVRIVKVQSRFAFGRMEGKPLTASPARKTPDCAAYPRCGGCTGRHMTYETTLEAKRQQVQDCFRRIGHIDIDVPPVLGMADPSHYRNKTALPVGGTVAEPVAGFFAPRSHDIIPIAQCPNAMPPADEICRRVLGWMKRFHVEPYVEETHTGLVRHIVVRVNRKGEAMAVLAINGSEIPHEGELVASLKAAGAVSVFVQGMSLWEMLKTTVLGYYPAAGQLKDILSGGGIVSMVKPAALVFTTGLLAGLLDGICVLKGATGLVEKLAGRCGRFAASAAVSLGAGMIFCNQSVVIVMGNQLLHRSYTDRNEQAVDMENSGIVLSALIPWNIACSIPLVMLGVDERAIPYAVMLYMIPLVYGLTKRWVYPAKRQAIKE